MGTGLSMEQSGQMLVSSSRLRESLRALGVCAGQTLLMHASVRSVGWVAGGPDVIIQALLDELGPAGTLCMYASWEEWEQKLVSFDTLDADQQRIYREECPPFDACTSRANRKWSILTEYLRTWTGARRSNHPTASVAAVGAQADWITENHPLNYGYGYDSPWDKVCQLGGKVLLLGSPLEDLTILHYAEHIARVPNKRIVHNQLPMLVDGERRWITFEEFDTCWGIRDLESADYFGRVAREYLASAKGSRGKVGGADSYLLDARDLVQFAVQWMENTWGE